MAILAYDDVMLREPRLLVPKQQPLGRIKVDWANPLACGLKSVIFPTGHGKLYDFISGARPTSDGATIRTKAVGKAAEYDTSNVTEFAGTTAYRVSTDFTIALMFDLDSAVNYSALVACQQTTVSYGWEVRGGSASADGRVLHVGRASAGYRFFDGPANLIQIGINIAVIPLEKNIRSVPTIVFNGSPYTLTEADGDSSTDDILAGTGNLRFGQRLDAVTKFDGAIYGFMLWHRRLSLAEALAISTNFYSVLTPA